MMAGEVAPETTVPRPLRVAVQMDPIEGINIDTDSTFALMLEAQRRGHLLWHYGVRNMTLREGVRHPGRPREERLLARAHPLRVQRVRRAHYTFAGQVWIDLATMDVVLMRQDPPFDMAYIAATHMLEHIHPRTLVVNDPVSVRNAPEKLLVTHFPELMPPTIVTWDPEAIRSFRSEHKDIIVKPLFGNGGAGVVRVKPDDENLPALLKMHFAHSREPLMFQRYEPAVRCGDKRIILVDGEPIGAVNRVPRAGDARANIHVGGRTEKCIVNARDREICAAIAPTLRERGMIFVGIDIIGDWLTEINVTSPTGIQEIDRFDGISIEGTIWDCIEMRRRAAGHPIAL
jgi:glutathione synthase